MARDRLGVRPIFYTVNDGVLVFGSEIKAILAAPGVSASADPVALDQIFTFWSPLSPRSFFRGIKEVPAGHWMLVKDGQITVKPYWKLTFPEEDQAPIRSRQSYLEEFRELIIDATRVRLRADVPVGAYLSGGLDSSTITAIIRNFTSNPLETFSISFTDPAFDESGYQSRMAKALGTDHHVVYATHADIGRAFPDVIWHTETPIMRTSPAPMFLLSGLVREKQLQGGPHGRRRRRIPGRLRHLQGGQDPPVLGGSARLTVPPRAVQPHLSMAGRAVPGELRAGLLRHGTHGDTSL